MAKPLSANSSNALWARRGGMCGADARDNTLFMMTILYGTVWLSRKRKFGLAHTQPFGLSAHADIEHLLPVLPIIGVTVQIHHGKNKYTVRFYAVEHAIGEAVNKATVDFMINL